MGNFFIKYAFTTVTQEIPSPTSNDKTLPLAPPNSPTNIENINQDTETKVIEIVADASENLELKSVQIVAEIVDNLSHKVEDITNALDEISKPIENSAEIIEQLTNKELPVPEEPPKKEPNNSTISKIETQLINKKKKHQKNKNHH